MAEGMHVLQAEHSLELQMGFLMHMMRSGIFYLYPFTVNTLQGTLPPPCSCLTPMHQKPSKQLVLQYQMAQPFKSISVYEGAITLS